MGCSSEIYERVINKVNYLIYSLNLDNSDEEITNILDSARNRLEGILIELKSSFDILRSNAEWDVFSIAFYGETNAGKSTLIETLRILLREPTKEMEREQFKTLYNSKLDAENQIIYLISMVEQINKEYQLRITDIDNNLKIKDSEKSDLFSSIARLNDKQQQNELFLSIKRELSIFYTIGSFFGILKEQNEQQIIRDKIKNYNSDLTLLNTHTSELQGARKAVQIEGEEKVRSLKISKEFLNNEITRISKELSGKSDGNIIGDGRSDYTRKVAIYEFESNGQKFAILDLPGIEGDEGLVKDEINDAVQKAHAVFYVSSDAKPPQTGDNQKEGTLEKIKNHLSQQTEVYSIYNKRIKNYKNLVPNLVNDDEKNSLKDLDERMRERLGDHYREHFILSAFPAFLSIANCYENDFEREQKKFFSKVESPETLLKLSQVSNFSDWIKINLVKNCREKIKKSNYKKIKITIEKARSELSDILNEFKLNEEKLIKTKKGTDYQLDEAVEILKENLNSTIRQAVNAFTTQLRIILYSDIDKGLDNNEFRRIFELRKKEEFEKLREKIEKAITKIISEFEGEIMDIVKKHNRYETELLNNFRNLQFDFNFEIPDFNKKVNWGKIIGVGLGLVALFINPAAWGIIVIGAAMSIGREVWGYFDPKYRKSHQKKISEDLIKKMEDNILNVLLKELVDGYEPINSSLEKIKNELLSSIDQFKSINKIFNGAKLEIELLITEMEA